MQVTKLFRQYREIIISAGVLITCVLGLLLGVIPLVQKTMTLRRESKDLSAEVEILKQKVAILQSVDEDAMKRDVQTLLSAVPSDKSISTVLGTLDGLTAKTGVSAGNFSLARLGSLATASAQRLTTDEKVVGSNIVPFTISISGSLDQIQAFLATSISVRRTFRVRTFNVAFQKTASGSASMASANVTMDAFYSPLPTTIGSVGQPLADLTGEERELVAKVAAIPLLIPPSSPLPPPAYGPAKADPFSL